MKPQAIKQHYITEFVNSGMSQQEAEEKWNEISPFVDENGFIRHFASNYDYIEEIRSYFSFVNKENFEFVDTDHFSKNSNIYFRPKSLDGIENNRGWTAILSEKDLPKGDSHTLFETCINSKNVGYLVNSSLIRANWKNINITHYKRYEPTADPIF